MAEKEELKKFDYHLHTKFSGDGFHSFQELVDFANKNGVCEIAFTDHNNIAGLQDLWRGRQARYDMPALEMNNVNIIPAVEITCRVSDVPNLKGNSSKVHLLVYAPDLKPRTPFEKVLSLKAKNDAENDTGILEWILKHKVKNSKVTRKQINEFINEKKKTTDGYSSISFNDAIEFLDKYGITPFKSQKEIAEARQQCPRYSRLNLEAKDVIKLAHDAGAMCVLAHPGVNLKRTPQPEALVNSLLDAGLDGFEMKYNYANEQYYSLIDSIVKRRTKAGKGKANFNKIVYTAGSDTHMITTDNTLGRVTGYDGGSDIEYDDVADFIDEMTQLIEARLQGKKTHRVYESTIKEELDEMVSKYTKQYTTLHNQATAPVFREQPKSVPNSKKLAKRERKEQAKAKLNRQKAKKKMKKAKSPIQDKLVKRTPSEEKAIFDAWEKMMIAKYSKDNSYCPLNQKEIDRAIARIKIEKICGEDASNNDDVEEIVAEKNDD